MKLYEIPKGSKIKVEEGIITFDHIDGMYSYCTCDWIEEPAYNVTYLSASTELKIIDNHYEIENS